jgi:dihydroorotate dehydrogenase (fumarate)
MNALESNLYGITIKSPIVVGACSFTARPEKVKELEAAGAAAIIVKSLFEEEIQMERFQMDELLSRYDNKHAEHITQHPHIKHADDREHALMVQKVKESVGIPVIASINAVTSDGWVHFAKDLASTGVDGLELNFYSLPLKESVTAKDIERTQLEALKAVKEAVSIPVGVKISPYYTHLTSFVKELAEYGADGITMFNRFFQPDLDIMSETESVTFSFSQTGDNLLPLRWTALLSDRVSCPLTLSNGVLEYDDVIKALLSGAASVQVVSTLYKNGIPQITELLEGIKKWMDIKGYENISDFRGKTSKDKQIDPWAFERVQYITMLLKKGSYF